MPPMIRDDESSGSDVPDEIPARPAPIAQEDEEDEEEDGSDDEEGEEYKVEKILKHDFTEEGVPIYLIKWLGYEKKADQTWEPVENLENAPEVLSAYHESIGGPPVFEPRASAKKPKGRGKRTAADAFEDSPAPEKKSGRGARKSNEAAAKPAAAAKRELPKGSWEEHVLRVISILEGEPDKSSKDGGKLLGLLEWKDTNDKKTQHPLHILRLKCPQKLLDYYEQHLVFTSNEDSDTKMDE